MHPRAPCLSGGGHGAERQERQEGKKQAVAETDNPMAAETPELDDEPESDPEPEPCE